MKYQYNYLTADCLAILLLPMYTTSCLRGLTTLLYNLITYPFFTIVFQYMIH